MWTIFSLKVSEFPISIRINYIDDYSGHKSISQNVIPTTSEKLSDRQRDAVIHRCFSVISTLMLKYVSLVNKRIEYKLDLRVVQTVYDLAKNPLFA